MAKNISTDVYYEVSVALEGMWKKNRYTYFFGGDILIGTIVIVPFGSSEKLGIVVQKTAKPDFKTKEIVKILAYSLPDKSIETLNWLNEYYPGVLGQNTQYFLPSFLKTIKNPEEKKAKDVADSKVSEKITARELHTLTEMQKKAVNEIENNPGKSIILHGITGSGKTRVYMELAKKHLAAGRDVLLLYPEISLTTQLEGVLREHFGKELVSVYNSKRTGTQQKKTWAKAHATVGNKGVGQIFIGPRSALFLPHANLGLVIIDEAHDGAYKQDSGSRYNGIMVAAALARTHSAQLVLGSASPPVQESQQILSKNGLLVCMHDLAKSGIESKKDFQIIDMTDKKALSRQSYLLSKKLLSQIALTLDRKKQTLLFLNRRGTARLLLCEDCGWHAECTKCELPLTYHHDSYSMRCHVCGLKEGVPKSCLKCRGSLNQKTAGIKAIEQELNAIFPQARIARFDSDNLKKDSFSERFDEIVAGEVDIVLGTQLITKGLDLPLLETVGILQADSALFLPDYVSEERSFQQLLQVSGRVGRGHGQNISQVLVQTYNLKNKIFSYVEDQDWHRFYEKELISREKNLYPPFKFVMKIWVQKKSIALAQKSIDKIATNLQQQTGLEVLGPAPSFYEKSGGLFSWQIIVKSSSRKNLSSIVDKLPKEALFDLDPVSLL